MDERTHPDNCIWICCCCGCLPVLGIIKGIIIVGPIFIISLFGFTGAAIILLPHDIFLTYKALCKTSVIGINLKIMAMFLLPIALFSWPIIVAFGGSLFGIIYGLFCPTVRTFDSDYNLIYGGIVDVFKDTFHYIGKFWDFNYDSYFTYLSDIEKRKVDNPFDISIIQIIIGLILAGYGSLVGVIVCSLLWIIKLIPCIYRLYYHLFKYYCELKGLDMFLYSLLFLIAIALVPAVGVLTILGYIGYGLYGGIYCAIDGYKHNIGRGIISIWISLRKCDYQTNEWIFDCECSFIPDCSDNCLKKDNPELKKNEDVEPEKESNEKDSATENLITHKNENDQDNNNLDTEGNNDNSNLKDENKENNKNLNDDDSNVNSNLKEVNKENNNNLNEEENQKDINLDVEENI